MPKPRYRVLAALSAVILVGCVALAYGLGLFGDHHSSATTSADPTTVAPSPVMSAAPVLATTSASSPSPKPSPSEPRQSTPSPSKPAKPKTAIPAGDRTFTFVNRTTQTIWLAGWQQTAKPALTTTGWVLAAGQTLTVRVPDRWNGRFWGRTGCSFDSGGTGHCQTGDCGGRFQCHGYGGLPATLAEYNLNAYDNLDFYDVSMVDGSNLPMYINITKGGTTDQISRTGCVPKGCTKPVDCPSVLRVMSGRTVIGCISACARLDTDQYCCRAQWAPRPMCDPTKWPVDYAAVFKEAEPYAYSYSDDDATSTFTCKTDCDYRITFGLSS